jgi:nicotinamidase-related amidase
MTTCDDEVQDDQDERRTMSELTVPTAFYQQFDADLSAEYSAETYGGWRTEQLPLSLEHTALVVMHAWDSGLPEQYPGWFRAVEYIPRSYEIARNVLAPLLDAARSANLTVLHVVGGRDYYSHLPGYVHSAEDAAESSGRPAGDALADPVHERLSAFRINRVFPGEHNRADVDAGFEKIDFLPAARPQGNEGIAATTAELAAYCGTYRVNHLIYTGFALDTCLLSSPGGMIDMSRRGYLCSTVQDAVTAVENKETVRTQTAKSIALWRVALHFGFVYRDHDLIAALAAVRPHD